MELEDCLKQYQHTYKELEPDENGRRVEVTITCEGKITDTYITWIPDDLFIGGSDYSTYGGRKVWKKN